MIRYNVADRILDMIAQAMEKRTKVPLDVELVLDITLDEFTGRIRDGVLSGGSYGQLWDLAGRILRHPELAKPGVDREFKSHKQVCGMYFASHNKNYLDVAPLPELFEYIIDLALWGMNTFKMWHDMYCYKDMSDAKDQTARTLAVLRFAKRIGVKTLLVALANEPFSDTPPELLADWTCGHDGYIYDLNAHYHLEVCPSKPGGMEKILANRRDFLEALKDAHPDYVVFGAYDQGGCTCAECAPWGSNGFIRCVKALIPLFKEYWPNTRFIPSLWQFGTFTGNEVEFEGFKAALNNNELEDVDYLISEPQYASYPFEKGMPRPLLNFPEISMYQAYPWGGYGGNPLPKLLQGLWDKNGDKLEGGLPYSEGFFEDLNKVICLRHYRDNQNAFDTVREYLQWEFGLEGELLEEVFQAVCDMEDTLERKFNWRDTTDHTVRLLHPEKVATIEAAVIKADAQLPAPVRGSKRWKLIYLRGIIDAELARAGFVRNQRLMELFMQVADLYYLHDAKECVRPDIWE